MTSPSDHSELTCPKCDSPLQEMVAPFYLRGELVGTFESLVCDMCHFSALTSDGYQEATHEAEKFGLIGPAFDVPSRVELPTSVLIQMSSMFGILGAGLASATLAGRTVIKLGEKAEAEVDTSNNDTHIIHPEYHTRSSELKETKYEIPIVVKN